MEMLILRQKVPSTKDKIIENKLEKDLFVKNRTPQSKRKKSETSGGSSKKNESIGISTRSKIIDNKLWKKPSIEATDTPVEKHKIHEGNGFPTKARTNKRNKGTI